MDHLLTEANNPASVDLDRLTPLEFVQLMNAEDAKVIPAVAAEAERIARAIEIIAERFQHGGRLIYVGAGTSGRLGVLDASECPPTFNSLPSQVVGIIAGGSKALTTAVEGAEDHPEFAQTDLNAINLNARDVLVGIATSGRTPYVMGALQYARTVGAVPIGITCVPDSDLAPLCDLVIAPLVGPEVLTGSTRMKAGTATKLVLNTFTTGAMVRIGKTHGNLMVDLRATNSKLKARTNRIVRHFTGLSAEAAGELLQRCDGELKTAIVAQRLSIDAAEARRKLTASNGSIREAIHLSSEPKASATDLILGIDGGGSHTTALLARVRNNDFDVVGKGRGGPSNLRAVGEAVALRALDEAIADAFREAGLPRETVAAAVFGLAGAGREVEQTLIKTWAQQRCVARSIEVVGDSTLLFAMLPEQWGIAVIAGTGSAVWGQSKDGRSVRVGGWGPLLGDEGSGYQIALAALRAILRQHDGRGPATLLTALFIEAMGVPSPDALIPAVHGGEWDRARLAELAEIVFSARSHGDATAVAIIDQAASDLTQQMETAVCALDLPKAATPVALAGGLILKQPDYRSLVNENLLRRGFHATTILHVPEPAYGALRMSFGRIGSAHHLNT
jgi:N-acetylmuramic acid 6-phosphate etherase